jgi:hypothetical protein
LNVGYNYALEQNKKTKKAPRNGRFL